jgi:hypothetical protein
MLAILSRYEASLTNAVTGNLSLLHGLQVARAAAGEDVRTDKGQSPTAQLTAYCTAIIGFVWQNRVAH